MGAAQEIAAAIHLLNDWAFSEDEPKLDLILVTRGGGSLEDLWAFNEEIVARAIYSSRLPVISGIGHEIDFTISDFVADFRAATPTAAAEIITEGVFAAKPYLAETQLRILELVQYELSARKEAIAEAVSRLNRKHPRRRLQEQAQWIDELYNSILRCTRQQLRQKHAASKASSARFGRLHPETILARWRDTLNRLAESLRALNSAQFATKRHRLSGNLARLKLLSPQNTLRRGYSITMDATGKVVRDASTVKPGDRLRTQIEKGEFWSRAEEGRA
jgi:exodeoxyribonuclease VII large subunit